MIGQNERRRLNDEAQATINEKVKQAWDCDLNIVYCVGENAEQHEMEHTEEVVFEQLAVLKDTEINWEKAVIVYEPLWAMGEGNITIATADQTQESCEMIRKWVSTNVNEAAAESVRIVYGGSVTEKNAVNFMKLADVDGFLVGTISTKPIFRTIFDMVNKQVESEKWN